MILQPLEPRRITSVNNPVDLPPASAALDDLDQKGIWLVAELFRLRRVDFVVRLPLPLNVFRVLGAQRHQNEERKWHVRNCIRGAQARQGGQTTA